MDYGQHYGFSRMPFGEGADREVFFRAETHKEALALLLYGIRERKGFVVLFGERGMGKTTIIRQAMAQLDERTRVALISKPHTLYYTLLKELMGGLGLPVKKETKGTMLHELYEYLNKCLKNDENVVIILDDAHKLSDEIIEELRLMSNLETSRTKLIQIVIVGEPELQQRLNSKHMRQIKQRIRILHRLLPLSSDESLQYIEHRLAWAGGNSGDIFTSDGLAAICKYAGGIPRNINALCDRTLTLGMERSEKPISARTVADARKSAEPLVQPASASPASPRFVSALRSPWSYAALAVAAGIFLGGYYFSHLSDGKPPNSIAQQAPSRDAFEKQTQSPGAPAEKRETLPAPPVAEAPGSVTREPAEARIPVKEINIAKGATLTSIAARYYGVVNATVLDNILEANRGVTDVDFIKAGSQIRLPQNAGKARLVTGPEGSFSVHAATFMTYREAQDYAGKIGPDLGRVDIVKKNVAPRKDWYRILVGPFASREEVGSALQSLERSAPQ